MEHDQSGAFNTRFDRVPRLHETQRMPNRGKSQFTFIAALTIFIGWLPAMFTWLAMEWALKVGADRWPDVLAFLVFGALYIGLIGAGAWVFSRVTKA